MIALFLIIVAAIIFAPIIKAVGKAGIFLLLILIGIGWIGSQFNGTTTARTVTTPTIQTASSPAPEQSEGGSADKTSAHDDVAPAPTGTTSYTKAQEDAYDYQRWLAQHTPAPETAATHDNAAPPPAPIPTASPGEFISHAEPGSATEWNEEDTKEQPKRTLKQIVEESDEHDEEMQQRVNAIVHSRQSPAKKMQQLGGIIDEVLEDLADDLDDIEEATDDQ